ncbi:4-aminobutyrate aminotransferase [Escherichia coli]|nr:4-aminobutyrate aminotransferase [Escherichia coli]
MIEPVQGEGGFYASSPAFMQRLRALCDEHGIMLIADEVQSGAGRTGTLFAMEQMGVAPDLTTLRNRSRAASRWRASPGARK